MDAQKNVTRLIEGQTRILPLYCMALLAIVLAGCAGTGGKTSQIALKSLSTCEQDLAKIKEALCSGELEAKPGTDPHDVIGLAKPGTDPHEAVTLAKPGTDPHKACITRLSVSLFDQAACSCEIEKTKLMGNIVGCYEKADGNSTKYQTCLNTIKSTVGLTCPSM
jgi:hypothetical protein